MTNINFIKTLTAGVVLTMAIYPQARAVSYSETTCDDVNGLQCWSCGANCKATLYNGGKLVISGTGAMNGGDNMNVTWTSSNPNLAQTVTSVEFKEGITAIGKNAFWNVPSVREITLADSIQIIEPDGINTYSSIRLIMTENSLFNNNNNYPLPSRISNVFCRGDIEKCREKQSLFHSSTIFTDEIRDADGNLLEKCSSSGCLKYDTSGKILGSYDFHDNLVAEYNDDGNIIAKYDSDGNQTGVYKYDGAGNLTAAYENGVSTYSRTSYTPAEAAAAVKKGNKNKIIFTFK